MIELYDKRSGDVKGGCRCSPGDTPPTAFPTVVIPRDKMLRCSAFYGPGGNKECVRESGYNDYQWVTCASNSYLREKTNGSYVCTFGSYCPLNCMIELCDIQYGDVKRSCQCFPGDVPPRTFPTVVIPTAKCFNAVHFPGLVDTKNA